MTELRELPLDDILLVVDLLKSINKSILNGQEHTGRTLGIQRMLVTVPESRAFVQLYQDSTTGMMQVKSTKLPEELE